jgi:hypothetical protein
VAGASLESWPDFELLNDCPSMLGLCGMKGIYQHCGEAHLHRYLAEFDFRYNRRSALGISDTERALDAIKGAAGRRLMYSQSGKA